MASILELLRPPSWATRTERLAPSAMEISAFVVVVALGSLLQGILGFASALVGGPLALLFLPEQTVVSSSLMVRVSLNGYVSLPFP